MDTIFALATPPGKSGVAVVRVSGPDARSALAALGVSIPPPRQATLAELRVEGEVLDKGLVLFFPAPHSFTGEDVAECQVHGSRAVILKLLAALGTLPRTRPAEPGEFTRRAFLNGKMDLTEAEGLADLIDAETEAQRSQALRLTQGEAAEFYRALRAGILEALALTEAYIDFPEEGIPAQVLSETDAQVRRLAGLIAAQIQGADAAERVRDGVQVAILGPPNAGKSSLMNLLAGRDIAIVSEVAGTTRDVIELRLDIGGFAVVLADTAGIRESQDAVEREGVRRSLARAEEADIRILVLDAQEFANAPALDELITPETIILMNKMDIHQPLHPLSLQGEGSFVRTDPCIAPEFRHPERSDGSRAPDGDPSPSAQDDENGGKYQRADPLPCIKGIPPLPFSAKNRLGLEAFLSLLSSRVADISASESSFAVRRRHSHHLRRALVHLERFGAVAPSGLELGCEELRRAAVEIGRITGAIATDEVLGLVFGRFCIGK